MTQTGTWVSYGGAARVVLALVLLAAAASLAYAGTRLPLPSRAAGPSRAAAIFMVATWVLAIATFLTCVIVYAQLARHGHIAKAPPANPITPVTFIGAGAVFAVILISSTHRPWTRLASAAVGAMAAPMIFELPFDLIVMARTFPPIPPDPALYRALFFLPLFLVEVTTLSLLTLSPMARLSKATFFSLALMLIVFAAWGLSGFAYPSAPVPITLNVLSKILAFGVALSLFLPQRALADVPGVRTSASTASV